MTPRSPPPAPRPSSLEVWAGAECSADRIGDRYFDQLARSAHADRLDNLDRLAALGVRAVRYPVLWELTAPDGLERADWRWADERLERLLRSAEQTQLRRRGSGGPRRGGHLRRPR